ncbi:pseudouridine synthase [Acaricomes phytoseiuli]|uniref:pseudouridine synthase n=1 Tax=Acaricomes phytoseiuli TaxID=291968 RepID=UPI00035FFC64|nr:pseudouridine synthase [Acaricomes phytoseiuli]MCW1249458.1 pseudouridine synthase [Acaricomes phytoseiuli]
MAPSPRNKPEHGSDRSKSSKSPRGPKSSGNPKNAAGQGTGQGNRRRGGAKPGSPRGVDDRAFTEREAGKPAGASARNEKPGRPEPRQQQGKPKGKAAPRPRGPQPFSDERFGANLGPYHGTPAAPPRRAQPQSGEARGKSKDGAEGVRLQKVMAAAGVASRRVCEEMILDGRVEVNGEIVTELGTRVDPATAAVAVDGIRLQLKENAIYLAFNKPRGVVSTMDDPEGRKNISDFLKHQYAQERLFHVGRLDANTEGLLLLTNDGELANRLTHPRYEVPKTYLVQTRGPMEPGIGKAMRAGIELEDGVTAVDSFKLVDSTPGHVLVEVVLHSGKNRIVRRLFDAVGYPVERLVRVQVGPVRIGGQKAGSIRPLSNHEIGHLLASVGL